MKRIRKKKGQALIEFTIILPILLLLLMGIIQFGMILNSYLTIQNSSREGARLGIVGGADIDIKSLITSISPNLNNEDISVTVTPDEADRNPGEALTVSITYNYHLTVPIISAMFRNSILLKTQTTMRME